jgi:hypothetical protein
MSENPKLTELMVDFKRNVIKSAVEENPTKGNRTLPRNLVLHSIQFSIYVITQTITFYIIAWEFKKDTAYKQYNCLGSSGCMMGRSKVNIISSGL